MEKYSIFGQKCKVQLASWNLALLMSAITDNERKLVQPLKKSGFVFKKALSLWRGNPPSPSSTDPQTWEPNVHSVETQRTTSLPPHNQAYLYSSSNGATTNGSPTAVEEETKREEQIKGNTEIILQLADSSEPGLEGRTELSSQIISQGNTHYKSLIEDIVLFATDSTPKTRRLLLDLQTEVNVMADEVQRQLKLNMAPYVGEIIHLPNRHDVKPIGEITARWKILGTKKIYTTPFLVIRNSYFDVMLGEPYIKEHELAKEEPRIAEWIQLWQMS